MRGDFRLPLRGAGSTLPLLPGLWPGATLRRPSGANSATDLPDAPLIGLELVQVPADVARDQRLRAGTRGGPRRWTEDSGAPTCRTYLYGCRRYRHRCAWS